MLAVCMACSTLASFSMQLSSRRMRSKEPPNFSSNGRTTDDSIFRIALRSLKWTTSSCRKPTTAAYSIDASSTILAVGNNWA